ncbi:glycerophosphodiester phosphodiesterase family protein [Marininema halotolerans]|uniref:Glycerophosphoryl diester phosphodiesterase n=1 Tax=Marininema halotolerans TaxID=1155944 RepID=A0A1I6T6L3_9BACL|nr:glycerophosphodiester phosphodiesterase family protein [Marininema halotolerans]SFS84874.1 Glycerophosphoryl diester phosphodiesterase [Marininema halotolerans]
MKKLSVILLALFISLSWWDSSKHIASADPADPSYVISEDFNDNQLPSGWKAIEGDWQVEDGKLVGTSKNQEEISRITFGSPMENYRFEADLQFESVLESTRWTGLALDIPASGEAPWYQATLRSGSTASNGIGFSKRYDNEDNRWGPISNTAAPIDAGVKKTVHVAVEVKGQKARWYLNDQFVLEETQIPRPSTGVLGLIVNGATVSFDNVKVSKINKVINYVMNEDFNDNQLPSGWKAIEGDWQVEDGKLVGTSKSQEEISRITFGSPMENYRFEADLQFESVLESTRWTGLALDIPASGEAPWYQATLRSGSTASNGIGFSKRYDNEDNRWGPISNTAAPIDAGVNKTVHVAVEVQGKRARWYLNDQFVYEEIQIPRPSTGVLGLIVNGATVSFDNVKVSKIKEYPSLMHSADPLVVAHRGNAVSAPENTIAAFKSAISVKAPFIETDTRLTSDGVPVIMHDPTVDRTTDHKGKVSDYTYEEIRSLNAGDKEKVEKVPSLAETLDLIKSSKNKTILLLEIKKPVSEEGIKAILDKISSREMEDQVIVECSDELILQSAQTIAPEIPRTMLYWATQDIKDTNDPNDPINISKRLGLASFQLRYKNNDDYKNTFASIADKKGYISKLHKVGIPFFTFTLNQSADWDQAKKLGVDGIFTDNPGGAVKWFAEH